MLGKRRFRFDFWTGITLISLIFFGMFLIYPVGRMAVYAFQSKGAEGFSIANFLEFFSRAYYLKALKNSVVVTLCATVIAIAIGVPLAYITVTCKIRLRRLIDILVIISMLSPPFIGA